MTQENAGNPGDTGTAPPAPTKGLVEELVGPGKKFDSIEALAKGKLESDKFIPKLTQENNELRSAVDTLTRELEVLKTRTSILDRLKFSDDSSDQSGEPNRAPPPPPAPTVTGLTADEVRQLVSGMEQDKIARSNLATVEKTITKTFGSDAVAYVRQKGAELGLSNDELIAIGAKNPQALFKLLDLQDAPQINQGLYRGAPATPKAQNGSVRNQAYYDGLKKQMGSVKFVMDRDMQVQMHKDMVALGDAWDS